MTERSQLQEIQRKVRRYRIERSITQKEMASLTGISLRSIQRFENGNDISLEYFLKILQVLDLLDAVVGAIPDMDNRPSAYLDKSLNRTKERAHKSDGNHHIEFKWGDEQ